MAIEKQLVRSKGMPKHTLYIMAKAAGKSYKIYAYITQLYPFLSHLPPQGFRIVSRTRQLVSLVSGAPNRPGQALRPPAAPVWRTPRPNVV